MRQKNKPLKICDTTILPGERVTLAFPTPELYTCIPMYIPIHVIHGKNEGPCVIICAAFHGDEINGISTIQNLLKHKALKSICGTIIAIPVINVLGLTTHSRNLPDHRDLEKNFPGSESGSAAARLTHFLHQEIFSLASHIIDIHTGEPRYTNHPQILTDVDNPELLKLAQAFNSPVIKHTSSKNGLLGMNDQEDKNVLIYQAGEALRLDPVAIRYGMNGIVKVLRYLGVLTSPSKSRQSITSLVFRESEWVRSPGSGLCKIFKKLGQTVKNGELLGTVSDPFGTKQSFDVRSPHDGVVISCNTFPLLNEGDHLLEIAFLEQEPGSKKQDEAAISVAEEWAAHEAKEVKLHDKTITDNA